MLPQLCWQNILCGIYIATCWYKLVNSSTVVGGWNSWITGPCSKTCGGGMQKRTRVCDNPKPFCGGQQCQGPSTDYIKCNDFCCPGKM